MVYRVTHLTSYKLRASRLDLPQQEARLTPRTTNHQRLLRSQLLVEPAVATHDRGDRLLRQRRAHWFSLQEAHTHFDVTAVSEIDISPFQAPAAGLSGPWEQTRDRLREERSVESLGAFEFVFESPHIRVDADLVAYAQTSFTRGRPLLEAVLDLTRRIHAEFQYQPGSTTVATPLREVLRAKRGVCQDFAHLEIGMLRSLGLAARYVSGYVYNPARREGTRPDHGRPTRRTLGSASIALISAMSTSDPTNGCIPSDEHVTLAWGRDFSDASPLKGVILGGGEHTVSVSRRRGARLSSPCMSLARDHPRGQPPRHSRTLPDGFAELIYIDPPFNTGRTQRRTRLRVTADRQRHSGAALAGARTGSRRSAKATPTRTRF